MLSALIPSALSYSAMHLTVQPMHQWCVHPGPLVLWAGLLRIPTSAEDRDQTVSRRSEPSSRAALIGEQPNPWDLLQPQDATSRHRGAKPRRRYELLGVISLFGRQPPQLNYPPGTVPDKAHLSGLGIRWGQSGISPADSTHTGVRASQSPAYATQSAPDANTKV